MHVIAYSRTRRPEVEQATGVAYVELDELLAKSDFISLHAPAADGGPIVTAETIARMKDGVVIVNTSRGVNVDEDVLLAALESGKVRAAGLDVYAEEPTHNHALYSHPWSPARRTSARRPSRRRSASARRSWTSSARRNISSFSKGETFWQRKFRSEPRPFCARSTQNAL